MHFRDLLPGQLDEHIPPNHGHLFKTKERYVSSDHEGTLEMLVVRRFCRECLPGKGISNIIHMLSKFVVYNK